MPDRVTIGRVVVGSRPRFVVSLGEGSIRPKAKSAQAWGADIIEIRCDRLEYPEYPKAGVETVKNVVTIPIISTIRWQNESDEPHAPIFSEKERMDQFSRIIPLTDAVDIEIRSEIFQDVAREARRNKKTVIASYHNFREIPSDAELHSLVRTGLGGGGHMVKIAAFSRSFRKIARLLALCLSYPPGVLTVIALGPMGRISRIAAPLFGSGLIYCSVDDAPYGPGQMTLRRTKRYVKLLYQNEDHT